jgi:hypothetical protein
MLDIVVTVLLIIGALNWGLIGFFNFNLVAAIFGEASAISRVIYALVGLSALYDVFSLTFGFKAIQHRWCEVPTTMK